MQENWWAKEYAVYDKYIDGKLGMRRVKEQLQIILNVPPEHIENMVKVFVYQRTIIKMYQKYLNIAKRRNEWFIGDPTVAYYEKAIKHRKFFINNKWGDQEYLVNMVTKIPEKIARRKKQVQDEIGRLYDQYALCKEKREQMDVIYKSVCFDRSNIGGVTKPIDLRGVTMVAPPKWRSRSHFKAINQIIKLQIKI